MKENHFDLILFGALCFLDTSFLETLVKYLAREYINPVDVYEYFTA